MQEWVVQLAAKRGPSVVRTAYSDPVMTVTAPGSGRHGDHATGRTSPVASSDVAEVVTAVLSAPQDHVSAVFELAGPATLDVDRLAEQYAQALG